MRFQTVSVANDSLTHILKIYLIGTLRFELRTQMINVTVYMLFETNANKMNTDKSSRNNCTKQIFRLALFCSIMLVTVMVKMPVDTAFLCGRMPISSCLINPCTMPHIRSGLSHNRDKLAVLYVAYLLLVY